MPDTPPDCSEKRRFIACASHRARRRVLDILGERQSFYRMKNSPKGIYEVSMDEWLKVKDIPGVSRTREEGLHQCW